MTPSKNLAARAGAWSARHRKTAIFGWLAFVAIAFVLATMVGRVAHGRVSFRGHGSRGEGTAWRFFVVSTLGFVLNQLFTWVLVTGPFFGGPTWWPLIPALFVTPLVTFALSRLWVFR